MNIAIIHNKCKRGGGMESYLFDLLTGFSQCGDQVHVFAYHTDRTPLPDHCQLHKTSLAWLPRKLREYAFLRKYRHRLPEEFDLTISLNRAAYQDISVCGGTHPGSLQSNQQRSFRQRWHDHKHIQYERDFFTHAKHIVAHSQLLADEIQRYYPIPSSKISVIYPPCDTEKFHAIAQSEIQAVKNQLNLATDKINLLFPSCDHARKGLVDLLAVLKNLDKNRYQLFIAGRNSKQALPENVHFIGYIDNLAATYAAMDYTVLPSHYEPFGLIVPESILCGTPVIIGKNVGAAELISEQQGILLADNSRDTLQQALVNLEKNTYDNISWNNQHPLDIQTHITQLKNLLAS